MAEKLAELKQKGGSGGSGGEVTITKATSLTVASTSATVSGVPDNLVAILYQFKTGAGNIKHEILKNMSDYSYFVVNGSEVTSMNYDQAQQKITFTYPSMGGSSGYAGQVFFITE